MFPRKETGIVRIIFSKKWPLLCHTKKWPLFLSFPVASFFPFSIPFWTFVWWSVGIPLRRLLHYNAVGHSHQFVNIGGLCALHPDNNFGGLKLANTIKLRSPFIQFHNGPLRGEDGGIFYFGSANLIGRKFIYFLGHEDALGKLVSKIENSKL